MRGHIARLEAEIREWEKRSDQAEKRFREAVTCYGNLKGSWSSCLQECRQLSRRAFDSRELFMQRCREAGFLDRNDYERAIAGQWADSSYRASVCRQLEEHAANFQAVQVEIRKARMETEGKVQPDLPALEQAEQHAMAEWKTVHERWAASHERWKNCRRAGKTGRNWRNRAAGQLHGMRSWLIWLTWPAGRAEAECPFRPMCCTPCWRMSWKPRISGCSS